MTLSFQADPPIPYHTFHFHHKRLNTQKNEKKFADVEGAVSETGILIRKLLGIPDEFDILICRSEFFNLETESGKQDMWIRLDQIDPDQKIGGISQGSFGSESWDSSSRYPFVPYINLRTGALFRNPYVGLQSMGGPDYLNIDYSLSVPILPQEAFHGNWFSFSASYGIGAGLPVHIWVVRKTWIVQNEDLINFKPTRPDPVSVLTLNLVLSDLISRGIAIVRNEIIYKSLTLYQALEQSKNISPVISEENARSQTIICGKTELPVEHLQAYFLGKGISLDTYAGDHPFENIVRIANFPVHSKEQVEKLADIIAVL